MEYRVEIYQTERGRRPFVDWMNKLRDSRGKKLINQRIQRISDGDMGDYQRIQGGGGVLEFRVHSGPGYRIYFGRVGERIILLLCGGMKRSQRGDSQRAKRYLADYKERVL